MSVILSGEKYNFYKDLIFKYLNYSFKNIEEEREFILFLKNLQEDDNIDFEEKICLFNKLTSGVVLKKFDTILF